MKLSGIIAYSQNRVMGKNNQLPWHLPDDLKHFKALTIGKPIVMGRKTFESLGKPLPNRRNIILSRDKSLQVPGCEVIHSIEELAGTEDEIMVIGGAEVFKLLLPHITTLYLTEVLANVEGDTFLPDFDSKKWRENSREHHPKDEKHAYAFDFVTLKKT